MSNNFSAVHLDGVFLNKYLGKTSSLYISVFICAKALECCESGIIAKRLSISEEEAAEAIDFWREKGEIEERKEKKHFSFDERPVYYAEELKIYAEKNEYVRKMFDAAQKYLGRLLTHSDLSAILSFHHWLGLEPDTVEVLLRYCSEKGHRNMRYIERVAIDWAENEILTKEQAEERIRLYNTDYRAIMRAMGQSGRNPVAAEEKYMKAWLEEMKMPLELIELACEKTVMNTGKASFGYANRIISDWKNKGFKTVDEVRKAESEFAAQKAKTAQTQKIQPKKNAFLNYQQRDYDFDEIERLEYEKNRRENL